MRGCVWSVSRARVFTRLMSPRLTPLSPLTAWSRRRPVEPHSDCLQRYSLFVNDMQSQIFILARPAASLSGPLIGREIAAAVSTNQRPDINQALREGGVITYTLANTF